MATRHPFTWLVVDTVPDHQGCDTILLGRASYDGEGDLLTVTTLGPTERAAETAQVKGQPMQALAKLLLRELVACLK